MKTSILRPLLLLATLLFVCNAAWSQYVWVDEKGVKQFSDQPPPPSVPKSKILKFSGRAVEAQDPLSGPDSDTPPAKEKAAPSIADQEMAFKKRQADAAKAQKKADDEAKNAAAKLDNCKRMREYKQSLDSGQRIAQLDANGNKSYLTDEKRAEEQNTINQGLASCGN